jgi:UDP-N-acetylglucosamine:LPS N-acetylglucosamine transferase
LPAIPVNCRVYDHLAAAELEPLIRRSAIVLSRPGYSTVMDLVRLGRRAIFVPTPGQTEQEYLGSYLSQRGLGCCLPQRQFSLPAALAAARSFPFRFPEEQSNDLLKTAIAELLAALPAERPQLPR